MTEQGRTTATGFGLGGGLLEARDLVRSYGQTPALRGASVSVAAGAGFLASQLFLSSELSETLRPPGIAYYVIVFGGLAASLGVIAATFPLLDRITGPEVARNE